MVAFLTVIYVIVCLFLIFVVLLQAGRGGGMGAAFGGSSQTVFGGAGAGNFLTRLTVLMAALFMLLSASLAYMSTSNGRALEKTARAIKLREEARTLEKAKKAGDKAATAAPASSSSPTSTVPAESATSTGSSDAPGAAEPANPGASAPAAEPPAQKP